MAVNTENFVIDYSETGNFASVLANLQAFAAAANAASAAAGATGTGGGGGGFAGGGTGGTGGGVATGGPVTSVAIAAQTAVQGQVAQQHAARVKRGAPIGPAVPTALSPDLFQYPGMGGVPPSAMQPWMQAPGVGGQGVSGGGYGPPVTTPPGAAASGPSWATTFLKNFETSITDPQIWGRHVGWLIQSAVLYRVTAFLGTVVEGAQQVAQIAVNQYGATTRTQTITGGGRSAASALTSETAGIMAAYGVDINTALALAPSIIGVGQNVPGGSSALGRAVGMSSLFGLSNDPASSAQLLARSGIALGIGPERAVDLQLRALRAGSMNPEAALAATVGLSGMAGLTGASTTSLLGLMTGIQNVTGRGPGEAASLIGTLQSAINNPQSAAYLESLGIRTGIRSGGRTGPASAVDVIGDIAGQWQSMSAAQKTQFAAVIGGGESVRDLDLMLSRWTEIQKVTEKIRSDVNATRDANQAASDDLLKRMQIFIGETGGLIATGAGGLGSAIASIASAKDANRSFMSAAMGGSSESFTEWQMRQIQLQADREHVLRSPDALAFQDEMTRSMAGGGASLVSRPTRGNIMMAGEYNRTLNYVPMIEDAYNRAGITPVNERRADFVLGGGGRPLDVRIKDVDPNVWGDAQRIANMGLAGVYNMPMFDEMNVQSYVQRALRGNISQPNVFSGGGIQGYGPGGNGAMEGPLGLPPGDVYLNGNKVGEVMASYSKVDMDQALRSQYSAGTGNAPVMGAPVM